MTLEDFMYELTFEDYKLMTAQERIDIYNFMYMLINNTALEYGLTKVGVLANIVGHCHDEEEYECLQILKDFELHHRHNLQL